MSRPVRYIALLLVVLVVGAAVTGIAFWTAANDPSNPDPGLYVNGRRVENPGPTLTVGENEVSFELFRHYYLLNKSLFEMYYDSSLWDDDPEGTNALILRDSVEAELTNLFAWLEIAKQEGVELDEEELAQIDETLAEQKEAYGAAFEEQLAGMFFTTEEEYLSVTAMQQLSQKAQTEYRAKVEAELEATVGKQADADYEKDYLSAKHILIMFNAEEEDTAKAEADALAKIEDLLQQIRDSEDPEATFDTLMAEYTEDVDADGNPNSPEGYTFTDGDMVPEFYEMAMATPVGEVSEPVKSTYGYHIILRLPLSDSQKETNRTAAVSDAASTQIDDDLLAMQETMPVVPGSYYDDITPFGII